MIKRKNIWKDIQKPEFVKEIPGTKEQWLEAGDLFWKAYKNCKGEEDERDCDNENSKLIQAGICWLFKYKFRDDSVYYFMRQIHDSMFLVLNLNLDYWFPIKTKTGYYNRACICRVIATWFD